MPSDPLRKIDVESSFGFKRDDTIRIISEGVFHGQLQTVIGFTEIFIITTVSGPPGEPDSSWWFEPQELVLACQVN